MLHVCMYRQTIELLATRNVITTQRNQFYIDWKVSWIVQLEQKMKKTVASLFVIKLKRNYLLSLLLLQILLFGTCRADSHLAVNISMPAIIFCIAITFMCTCFWICCCRMLFQRKHYHRIPPHPTAAQYSTYGPQTPSHYGSGTEAQYPIQSYIPPTTVLSPPSTMQRPYPHSVSPPATTPSAQTISQVYEPVSLPEATLHHGEPPPDYEEAIKMKPPDTVDQD